MTAPTRLHAGEGDPGRPQVTTDVQDGVAVVSLARPEARNAQSRRLLRELDDALLGANADPEVRVVLVRGEGPDFSAGHDLSPEELAQPPFPPRSVDQEYRHSRELFLEPCLRWRDLPKPTVAAIHGNALIAGFMIASAMDVIIAADDARILPALFQYFSVPWEMTARQAKELLFEPRFLSGEEARQLGLVNRVVPRDDLDREARAYAARLARQDPRHLRAVKETVNGAQDAMGFVPALRAAHTTLVLSWAAGAHEPVEYAGRHREPRVARALEREDALPRR